MRQFTSCYFRGLAGLVRLFSSKKSDKIPVWYTILNSEGSPVHKHLPDWTNVPKGTSVKSFKQAVRNDNISILTGIGGHQLLAFKNHEMMKRKLVLVDTDPVQINDKANPIVLVTPKIDWVTAEEFMQRQEEEFSAASKTRNFLSTLAQVDFLDKGFRCKFDKPTFGDCLRSQREFAKRENKDMNGEMLDPHDIVYTIFDVKFTRAEWDSLERANEASRRQLHCMRLTRTRDGKESVTFLVESGTEEHMESVLRKATPLVETIPGAEFHLFTDELKKP